MANPYQKYKQTAITSASREQILLMLYEGAIKFTKLAIQAAEQNKVADRGQNILRAYDIILELQVSLDHKVGGDLAKQLDQLYAFVLDQYTKANVSGDVSALKSSLKIIENLYEGWKQAVEKYRKEIDEKGGAA
ncbi:MAG: flagellar export chaperone FliS [Pseudobdellovibrio sp.]